VVANCPGVAVADLRADYDVRPLPTDGTTALNLSAGQEGHWSYGASADVNPLAGGFEPLEFVSNAGLANVHLNSWLHPTGTNSLPGIHNNNVIEPASSEGSAGPGEVAVHPGDGSVFFVARWTAASAGSVTLRGHAQDIGTVCSGVTFSLYVGGVNVLGPLTSTGNVVDFDQVATVDVGTHVDFVVGNRDGDFGCDQTALAAAIFRDATVCAQRACINNQCGHTFATSGTPVPALETVGNCRAAQCDGSGNLVQAVDLLDVPVDGDACTQDLCSALGVPSNPPAASGTPCSGGGGRFCNSTGACVECVAGSQCTSLVCDASGQCAAATCADNTTNGTETDTDCGGSPCPPCGTNRHCNQPGDCASAVCTGNTCQAPACGDGVINSAAEVCDDGNTGNGDGCSSTCTVETGHVCSGQPSSCATVCGDGFIRGAEACDDGSNVDGDGCSAGCAVEPGFACLMEPSVCFTTCGDGVRASSEACDDGNTASNDGCSALCGVEAGYSCTGQAPSVCTTTCGDSVRAGSETCDDGNTAAGDGCTEGCVVETGFVCVGSGPLSCSRVCGDGLRLGPEECDDGNVNSGDGCTAACTLEPGFLCGGDFPTVCVPLCGDGIMLGGEACDDGANNNGDGCSSSCAVETGWTCAGTPSVCFTTCGDGVRAGTELCDDGNTVDLDGCSATCVLECGNATLNTSLEQCDDGNRAPGDGCSPTCTFEVTCAPGEVLVQLSSADVPKAIPDNNAAGVDSVVVVTPPGVGGSVRSVMVGVGRINHTFDADLTLSLASPWGTRRTLVARRGSSGDNFVTTRLLDSATSFVSGGIAPFTNAFRPEQTLSDAAGFRFQNVAGTWSLRAVDSANGDTGTLLGWTLAACVDPQAVCGNGTLDPGEECDDGDTNDLNACSNHCHITDGCGDGNLDPGEQCDDDNVVGGDGCSATCTLEMACPGFETPLILLSNPATAITDDNLFKNFPIPVTTAGGVVRAMVFLQNITHANTAHLDIQLQSPLGTVRNLTDDNGTGANYLLTRLEDVAAVSVITGANPFGGTYRPESSLSSAAGVDFLAQNALGTWNLQVRDDTAGTAGVLNGWALGLCLNTVAFCGNGVIDSGEECDGNSPGVVCGGTCQILDGCGDGNLDAGEECDDNNLVSGDGCSSTCQLDISCGVGEVAVVLRNTTATPLVDNNGGTTSVINAPIAGVVRRVIPSVNITHAVDAQLDIFLSSPFGVQRELSTDQAGINYVATSFSDAAATLITAGTTPFTGTFRAEQTLSNAAGFANQFAAGGWILRVGDDTTGTTGTLNSWALALCVEPGVPPVCGNGYVEPGEQCDDGNAVTGDGCGACMLELNCPVGSVPLVFTSTDVPKVIPDNNVVGASSTIIVSAPGVVTRTVVVLASITHQFLSDVDIQLRTPAASALDLTSNNGGSGDDYVSTILDDAAPTSITSIVGAGNPFRGRFRPEVALSTINGQAAAGAWTLVTADHAATDAGMVLQWSLGLCVQ
jgi:cysteine-rich repeat protein